MTDAERDQIDNDAQMYMRTCSSAIKTLKMEGKSVVMLHYTCLAYGSIRSCDRNGSDNHHHLSFPSIFFFFFLLVIIILFFLSSFFSSSLNLLFFFSLISYFCLSLFSSSFAFSCFFSFLLFSFSFSSSSSSTSSSFSFSLYPQIPSHLLNNLLIKCMFHIIVFCVKKTSKPTESRCPRNCSSGCCFGIARVLSDR